MIEGLRLLPWLQQAHRFNPGSVDHLTNCEACMHDRSRELRQSIRCGYEPALATPPIANPRDPRASSTWAPDGFSGFEGNAGGYASTCPGYTTALPEVREVSWLHLWWSKSQLRDKLGGRPTDLVQTLIETLAAETSAVEAHVMAKANEKAKG